MTHQQHRMTDCPHRALAVGWALHALEPAGDSLVTAHLPDCPICTTTATQTEQVGATLGLAIPQTDPSTELEQRVLNIIGATRQAPILALAPPTPPARHITRRLWLRTKNWLRPRQ